MIKVNLLLLVAMALSLGLPAGPAQALLARTYVSSLGNDGNDCNRLTPCRTFQTAHDNTLPLGEITVLDPGGYGAIAITKNISIINDGVGEAGVLVSGGLNGITINAGASDAVTLRGLTIKGIGFGGGNGIVFNSGKSLTVENCVIRNLDGNSSVGIGIYLRPSGSSSFAITNTTITDNATGILHFPANSGAGTVVGTLDRVGLYNNGSVAGPSGAGLTVFRIGQPVDFTVTDSVASGNGIGFVANNGARLLLQRSAAVSNGVGISSNSNALVIVNQSVVYNNARGWVNTLAPPNGQVVSYGNNVVAGNAADEAAMPLFTPK